MYQRILVPFDGSAASAKGLDEASSLAKLTGAELRVVHQVQVLNFATGSEPYKAYTEDVIPHTRRVGEQILEQARARAAASGIDVQTVLLEDLASRVSDLVVEQAKAWNADLIVLGTHGRRGIGRLLLGSDAEQIVRSASVPVLLVRAPEVASHAHTPAAASATDQAPSRSAAI
jgi:nucleotide-binding universal stress UspA family protein